MIDAERERIGDLRGKVAVSPECPSAKRADESRRKQPQAKRPRTANTAHESSDDESRSSNDSEEAEFKEESNFDNTASWSCASAGGAAKRRGRAKRIVHGASAATCSLMEFEDDLLSCGSVGRRVVRIVAYCFVRACDTRSSSCNSGVINLAQARAQT